MVLGNGLAIHSNPALMHDRARTIRDRLVDRLHPVTCEVIDESHLHVGHAGARDGRGHFRVRITAPCFRGLPTLARHRLVYDTLGELMQTDIHALSIDATETD